MNVRLLNESEFHLWDSFIDECEHGTIFNKSFWLKNLFNFKNIKINIIAGFDKNNEIIAGFAFGYKLKFELFKIIVPPPITSYNSILIKERNSKNRSKNESHNFTIANEIIQFLNTKYHYIKITFAPNYSDIRPFIWNKFKEQISYTYSAEIKNVSDVIENFDSDIRRRIKKAEELPYNIIVDESEENINAFFQLQNLSFNKQDHSFKLSKTEFVNFIQTLFKEKSVKIYTVYLEKIAIASCVVVYHKHKAYYWLAGSNTEYLKTGLNQLLFKAMLIDLSNRGITHFDFVGANTNSIAKYKSTYNFNLTPYYSIEKINGLLLNLLFKFKEIVK